MSMSKDIAAKILDAAVTVGLMRHVMKLKNIDANIADAVIDERVKQLTDARMAWDDGLFNFVDPQNELLPEKLKKKNPAEVCDLVFNKAMEGYEVGYVHGFTDAIRAFFSEI